MQRNMMWLLFTMQSLMQRIQFLPKNYHFSYGLHSQPNHLWASAEEMNNKANNYSRRLYFVNDVMNMHHTALNDCESESEKSTRQCELGTKSKIQIVFAQKHLMIYEIYIDHCYCLINLVKKNLWFHCTFFPLEENKKAYAFSVRIMLPYTLAIAISRFKNCFKVLSQTENDNYYIGHELSLSLSLLLAPSTLIVMNLCHFGSSNVL